jgi:hypothetical protein
MFRFMIRQLVRRIAAFVHNFVTMKVSGSRLTALLRIRKG